MSMNFDNFDMKSKCIKWRNNLHPMPTILRLCRLDIFLAFASPNSHVSLFRRLLLLEEFKHSYFSVESAQEIFLGAFVAICADCAFGCLLWTSLRARLSNRVIYIQRCYLSFLILRTAGRSAKLASPRKRRTFSVAVNLFLLMRMSRD